MGRCQACGREYPETVAICIPCGVELATGRMLTSRLLAPDALDDQVPDDEPVAREGTSEAPGKPSLAQWVVALFPGAFRPVTLVAVLGAWALALVVLYIALHMFLMMVWMTAFMSCGLAGVIYFQSLVWLQTGRFVLLQNGLAEYVGVQWLVFIAGVLLPLTAFLLLLVQLRSAVPA